MPQALPFLTHNEDLPLKACPRGVECGDVPTDRAEGWRLALDCDDEFAAFCPGCWERESD